MVDYVIINGSDAELTNVNAGGTDVAARTISADVTLTDTELGDLIDAAGENSVALMNAAASNAEKLDIAQTILDAQVASVNLSSAALRDQFKWKSGLAELEALRDKLAD